MDADSVLTGLVLVATPKPTSRPSATPRTSSASSGTSLRIGTLTLISCYQSLYFPPEPTEAEFAGITSVRSRYDWAGITEDNRNTLLAGPGCDDGDSFRPTGGMDVDDFDAVVDALVINGQPPTPYVLTGWKLVGQVAAPTRAQRLSTPFAKAGQPLLASVPGVKVGVTKLATTLDQGLDDEAVTVSGADLSQGYVKYETRMGKPPSEDREPSVDQHTGIAHLISLQAPPHADSGVFGPLSIRLRERMRLGGFFIAADGTLEKCELVGPTSASDWSRSYRVLLTMLIMQEAVFPEELDAYHNHLASYASRYGDRCWPTIHQAEVRVRQERMQTIRRRSVQIHNADPQAAIQAGFVENKPWRYVWSQAVLESRSWVKEIREKCLLLLTKVSTAAAVLDGDVRVGGSGSQASAAQLAPEGRARSPRRAAQPPPVRTREHNANDDGTMKTNRSGKELCRNFQTGNCESPPGAPGSCPRDRRLVHQCAKCLSRDHGAHHPAECSKSAPRPSILPKGRGRSGGGRGSGRRGGRY